MQIFETRKGNLIPIEQRKYDDEKELQNLTEANLEKIFGLQVVRTEFPIPGFRIDTLAFDKETKSFVIIEYKPDKQSGLVEQGIAYLATMLNNKSDFILEYNERLNEGLRKDGVDWEQSRVIFVAGSFNKYQLASIGFKDLFIETWEAKKYGNNIFVYNQIKPAETNASFKTIAKSESTKKVASEIKKYTLDDHFKNNWTESKALYDALSERILDLDGRFEEKPTKVYIGFKIGNSVVVGIETRKSKLILSLPRVQPKDLSDPEKRVRYVKNSVKWYNKHISEYDIQSADDIDYAMSLTKQVYKKTMLEKTA